MTRLILALAPVALAAASLSASPASACCHLVDCVENVYVKPYQLRDKSCEILWILRNSIYDDAGYCFQTDRAKARFSNEGCRYTDQSEVPLNDYQRHNVGVIKAAEDRKGC